MTRSSPWIGRLAVIAAAYPWSLVVLTRDPHPRSGTQRDLVVGLWDAHREVGLGPGATWRPGAVDFLPFGVLRIDHVFGGPGTRPLTIEEDCAPRHSDHCVLRATVAIR